MNSYLIGFFSNEILQNEIILSQGFSFESILRGIVGMIFLIFVAYLFSNNRKAINWKSALIGLSTQLILAILVLKVNFVQKIFEFFGKIFVKTLDFTMEGSKFLLGDMVNVETFGYVLPFSFKSKSLRVMICEDIRWGRCDIKSTSLLGNVMNMNSSRDEGCDEVIMHKDNVLTEAGASNIFFTKNDVICTPKLSNSILPGITRSLLIHELNKAKLPIIEGVFSLEDLSKANAVWLTSSTKGISLVDEIINLESTLQTNDPLFIKSKSLFVNKFFS